jgi:hypothetical protein
MGRSSLISGTKTVATWAFLIVTGLSLLTLAGCGKNNGTPRPYMQPRSEADADRAVDGASLQLADSQHWRAQVTWDSMPRYNDEVFVEMTGLVLLRNVEGNTPQDISGMKFTADMPQHGHGTGNILPQIEPVSGRPGAWAFRNLFFTMKGAWRIRVSGTIDGQFDVWTTMIDVQ